MSMISVLIAGLLTAWLLLDLLEELSERGADRDDITK